MAHESSKRGPRTARGSKTDSRTGSERGSRKQRELRTEIGAKKRGVRGCTTSESAVRVINFSVAGLCARSTTTDAKTEPKWSRNPSRKQHKTRSAAPKVRSVAPEARYVAPWSCPVPAGVVTVTGTVAAVAVAVAGVVAVARTGGAKKAR